MFLRCTLASVKEKGLARVEKLHRWIKHGKERTYWRPGAAELHLVLAVSRTASCGLLVAFTKEGTKWLKANDNKQRERERENKKERKRKKER